MKQYEMLVILPGTLAEDEVAPAIDLVQKTLESRDATDIAIQDMGKSRLAYPIKHIRYGYFQLIRFAIEPTKLADAERNVRLLGNLLRVVITAGTTKQSHDLSLASDPTALSAPPRESHRDERPRRRSQKEDVVQEKKTEKKSVTTHVIADKKKQKDGSEREVKKEKGEKIEISMEDINKKLDQVIQGDMDKV